MIEYYREDKNESFFEKKKNSFFAFLRWFFRLNWRIHLTLFFSLLFSFLAPNPPYQDFLKTIESIENFEQKVYFGGFRTKKIDIKRIEDAFDKIWEEKIGRKITKEEGKELLKEIENEDPAFFIALENLTRLNRHNFDLTNSIRSSLIRDHFKLFKYLLVKKIKFLLRKERITEYDLNKKEIWNLSWKKIWNSLLDDPVNFIFIYPLDYFFRKTSLNFKLRTIFFSITLKSFFLIIFWKEHCISFFELNSLKKFLNTLSTEKNFQEEIEFLSIFEEKKDLLITFFYSFFFVFLIIPFFVSSISNHPLFFDKKSPFLGEKVSFLFFFTFFLIIPFFVSFLKNFLFEILMFKEKKKFQIIKKQKNNIVVIDSKKEEEKNLIKILQIFISLIKKTLKEQINAFPIFGLLFNTAIFFVFSSITLKGTFLFFTFNSYFNNLLSYVAEYFNKKEENKTV